VILVSHPTGSIFVRSLLSSLEKENLLHSFYTTVAFDESDPLVRVAPPSVAKELLRRAYPIPDGKIVRRPWREGLRLLSQKMNIDLLTEREVGWASIFQVYTDLDRYVASALPKVRNSINAVYCYEDGALATFRAAADLGLTCVYDLPIPYFQTARKLIEEEVQRLPDWAPTMIGAEDSAAKLERKRQEIELADVVVTNSRFTLSSLPQQIRETKKCFVAEYGAPRVELEEPLAGKDRNRPLRVLFAGTLSQRKGLADLFQAMKMLNTDRAELIVMGTPMAPMEFYRQQFSNFRYEKPRPHHEVLKLMQTCDVFVFPSILEGRGLVQMEAMACGLPLVSTANATGDELVDEGETGFLVPIRSPESIAEKISWFLDHRERIPEMGQKAREKISSWTWESYGQKIISKLPA
jgi:glycosyltransferase involved in cell wall biosynthesis